MTHTIKNILGLTISILLILSGTAISGQISTQVRGDRLDADLNKAPLRAVLADISQKTGIQVFLEQGLSGRVTAKFSNLTLEEGLKRILADYSNSMIFSKMKQGPAKGEIVLSEIKVFRKGNTGAAKFENLQAKTNAPIFTGPGSRPNSYPGQDSTFNPHAGYKSTAQENNISGDRGLPGNINTAMNKRDLSQIAMLRQQVSRMHQKLETVEDRTEKTKLKVNIAKKTLELKNRQAWVKTRDLAYQRNRRYQTAR